MGEFDQRRATGKHQNANDMPNSLEHCRLHFCLILESHVYCNEGALDRVGNKTDSVLSQSTTSSHRIKMMNKNFSRHR